MTRHQVAQTIKDSASEIKEGLTALIEVNLLILLWLGLCARDLVLWCWKEGKSIIEDAWEKL